MRSRVTRRWIVAVLGLSGAALVGFAYARPLTVLDAYGAAHLRLEGVRSAHVQAGPYRLHYLEAGSGPPLVLVHGLGSSATQDWGRLIAPLGRRFHVYAPDLPGFDRSRMWLGKEELLNWQPQEDVAKPYPVTGKGAPGGGA